MFNKPLFNPMLQGFTAEGMSLINGTQGLTTHGMDLIHGTPERLGSLGQQHALYNRREEERMRMREESMVREPFRYEPPKIDIPKYEPIKFEPLKYEILKYEPIKPFVPSYDLPVFDRSCPECGKLRGHYLWCGSK